MSRYDMYLWDTNSVYNPTRMNHIEQGIYDADLREGGTIDGDLRIDRPSTTTSVRYSNIILGNETAEGTVGNSQGRIRLCSNTTKYGDITADNLSSNRTYALPNKSGTITVDAYRVRRIEANTYSSYALALADLETYFDNLITQEKFNSYIMRTGGIKYPISVTGDKTFTLINITSSQINIQTLDLHNHTFNLSQTTTSGTTFSSLTNSAQNQALELWTQ